MRAISREGSAVERAEALVLSGKIRPTLSGPEIVAVLMELIREEIEACAKIVETHSNPYDGGHDCYDDDCKPVMAASIRARGQA